MSISANKCGWDGGKPSAGGEPSTNHQLTADVSIGISSDTFLTVERSSEVGAQKRAQKEGPQVLHGHRHSHFIVETQKVQELTYLRS